MLSTSILFYILNNIKYYIFLSKFFKRLTVYPVSCTVSGATGMQGLSPAVACSVALDYTTACSVVLHYTTPCSVV